MLNHVFEFLSYLWPFLTAIVILVTIHEFGHYWAARIVGVHVETFSIGFGPKLLSKRDSNGTLWQIALIPLGGYIKVLGEYDYNSENHHKYAGSSKSIMSKKPIERFFVAIAGPLANYISAMIFLFLLFVTLGQNILTNKISEVQDGTIAMKSGIKSGDKIISAKNLSDEIVINDISEIIGIIRSGNEVELEIQRGEANDSTAIETFTVHIDQDNDASKQRKLGVMFKQEVHSVEFFDAAKKSIASFFAITEAIFSGIMSIFNGNGSADQIAGPIRLAGMIKESAQDVYSAVMILILLSINLALMNLLPLPGLDGGTALISIIEMIIRRSISQKIANIINMIGFIMIIMITIYVLYADFVHIKIFQKLFG